MSSRPVRLVRPLVLAVAGLVFFASAGAARADMITYSGNTNSLSGTAPVSFSGTVTVTGSGTTSATVSVMLQNTTSATSGAYANGYITGFGFNLPGTLKATNTTPASSPFKFLVGTDPNTSTSLQAGEFDNAFSLSSKELHTIENNMGLTAAQARAFIATGLGANQAATFTFTVTAAGGGIVNLNASQIITDTSGSTVPFSVRFRSTNTGAYPGHNSPDGDKVPAAVVTTPPHGVPAPPGLVLAGMGFGCMLLGRLRRKAAPQA